MKRRNVRARQAWKYINWLNSKEEPGWNGACQFLYPECVFWQVARRGSRRYKR